ncbi:MAG: phage portal protein, partial [Rhodobacteraceae bacterium]|nr:phage portal protein [Paracoccaceae bacterium]
MGIFTKPKAALAISEPEATIGAAVGASNVGASQVGNYIAYTDGGGRERAMSLAVLQRGRDLICNTIGSMQLEMYREIWNGDEMEPTPLAPRSWLGRIDKGVPNSTILSWTADDLIFWGRAFWYVQERTADGYPSMMTRLPAAMVSTLDQQGPVYFGPSNQIYFNGLELNPRDVIQFISGTQGLLYTGKRAIEIAIRIEEARMRNASSAIPAGVLKQTGGEPLSGQELADLAASFNHARATNQTAALSQEVDYIESTATPDKMLMIDSA